MSEKPRDPLTPGQTERGVDPSSPTRGTEGADLGNNPPSAFQDEKKRSGPGMQSTPAARDAGEWTFRCAEAGHLNCNWSLVGSDREKMLPQIERHHREEHNAGIDEDSRNRILDAIHRRSAA